ncbi:MAG TPA: sporulation integral membrane protein YtvI [Limnochorda sp.]
MIELLLQPRTWLIVAVVVLAIIYRAPLGATLLPFFMAFLLAMLIDPAVAWVQKRARLPRPWAVLLVLSLVILVAVTLLSIIFVRVVGDLISLVTLAPELRSQLIDLTGQAITAINQLVEALPPEIGAYVTAGVENFSRQALGFIQSLVQRLLVGLSSLPSLIVVLVLTVMAAYFLSRDRDVLLEGLLKAVPARHQQVARRVEERLLEDLIGFLHGNMLIALMTTSIAMLGLFLMEVPYWTLLGLILGILDLIPVVGPGIVIFPWAATSLVLGRPGRALWLLILYAAIFLTRQMATPRLLGTAIGLYPVVTLLSIYGGILFFGPVGLLLGPVLAIGVKAALIARRSLQEEIAELDQAQPASSEGPGAARAGLARSHRPRPGAR